MPAAQDSLVLLQMITGRLQPHLSAMIRFLFLVIAYPILRIMTIRKG